MSCTGSRASFLDISSSELLVSRALVLGCSSVGSAHVSRVVGGGGFGVWWLVQASVHSDVAS